MSENKIKIYTVIRTDKQYIGYCNDLERMTVDYENNPSDTLLDLIDTVTLLIEIYDEQRGQQDLDPIGLLKSLIKENNLKQKDLAELLGVSKGHVSDILNYKKGLSKKVIRLLSERFAVRQSAFNRPY